MKFAMQCIQLRKQVRCFRKCSITVVESSSSQQIEISIRGKNEEPGIVKQKRSALSETISVIESLPVVPIRLSAVML